MKNEMKKKYVAPEMDVIQYEHVNCLLDCSSGSQAPGCDGFNGILNYNDGISDAKHV